MKTHAVKLMILVVLGSMLGFGCSVLRRSHDAFDGPSVRQINRSIKTEARSLRSDGYRTEVGAPAMEFQLRRSLDREYAVDELGQNQYVIGTGSAIAGIENVARMHAVNDAANNAAILLESKVMGMIETDYNNKLYSRDEFLTLSRMKGVFSNFVGQTLPTGVPVTAFIRDNGRNYEYQVRVAYSMEIMRRQAASAVHEILGKENDELRKKFERVTGLDQLGK